MASASGADEQYINCIIQMVSDFIKEEGKMQMVRV